jgi:NADH pyrophosphatase NudC (nudix superfamily)
MGKLKSYNLKNRKTCLNIIQNQEKPLTYLEILSRFLNPRISNDTLNEILQYLIADNKVRKNTNNLYVPCFEFYNKNDEVAYCGICGEQMQLVRYGKYQCNNKKCLGINYYQ